MNFEIGCKVIKNVLYVQQFLHKNVLQKKQNCQKSVLLAQHLAIKLHKNTHLSVIFNISKIAFAVEPRFQCRVQSVKCKGGDLHYKTNKTNKMTQRNTLVIHGNIVKSPTGYKIVQYCTKISNSYMRTERHNLYTSSIQHKLEKTKRSASLYLCLSECITISTFYKPTFKECLNCFRLNDFAKL